MKISDAFPSKYIKADDLGNRRVTVTVRLVTIEDIADKEYKPVMHFMGKDKGMVLNKTNAGLCASVWGDETDTWQGKTLELFAAPVMFQGRQVMGLSVAPLLAQAAAQPAQVAIDPNLQPPGPHDIKTVEPTKPGPEQDALADDIPF